MEKDRNLVFSSDDIVACLSYTSGRYREYLYILRRRNDEVFNWSQIYPCKKGLGETTFFITPQ